MNAYNALGFLLLGIVMLLLPVISPQWFPLTGMDGSSARALWLETMGLLQGAIGGVRVLRDLVVPFVARSLSYELTAPSLELPGQLEPLYGAEAA